MERKIYMPENASVIISELEKNGFRADIVGGCVRDSLLGKTPYDYDITTSASPDEMKEIFKSFKTAETGIKHGTLTVVIDSEPYEVTTYRLDGEYTDNRHPDSVVFTRDIKEDLSRRDFTVNAMAYNKRDGLLDIFGGEDDLSARIIRAVGEPMRRFSEDALRILRALRFASVLDFTIEEKTADALRKLKENLVDVSVERIYSEWKKLLSGSGAYRILKDFSDVVSVFIPELSGYSLPDEERFNKSRPNIRELSLFSSLDNPSECFISASNRLKTDTKHKTDGKLILEKISYPTENERDIHLLAAEISESCARDVIYLRILLLKTSDKALSVMESLINSGACFNFADMKIKGDDLIALGYIGKNVGIELSRLLRLIAMGEIPNEREALISESRKNLLR